MFHGEHRLLLPVNHRLEQCFPKWRKFFVSYLSCMPSLVITNIQRLVNVRGDHHLLRGKELAELPCIENAYLIMEDGEIAAYGRMQDFPQTTNNKLQTTNAQGATVLPAWCDSHTHLVFAASREEEFVDKLKGLSYADIAAKGGGILNSAKKLQSCSEDELFNLAWKRLEEVSASAPAPSK